MIVALVQHCLFILSLSQVLVPFNFTQNIATVHCGVCLNFISVEIRNLKGNLSALSPCIVSTNERKNLKKNRKGFPLTDPFFSGFKFG